jgi:hypothetical protein
MITKTEFDNNGKPYQVKEWSNTETPVKETYNCHGYSLAKGQFWINNGEVDALLKADGYESFDPIT